MKMQWQIWFNRVPTVTLQGMTNPFFTYSEIAQASPKPSYVEVPRPNSSIMIRDVSEADCNKRKYMYILKLYFTFHIRVRRYDKYRQALFINVPRLLG